MPLDWNIEKVKDHKEFNPKTERLLFLTMEVDLGEISAKNIDEWLVRLGIMKRVGWAPRTEITREDLERHIGLKTNVHSTSRAQFKTKVIKHIENEAMSELRRSKT